MKKKLSCLLLFLLAINSYLLPIKTSADSVDCSSLDECAAKISDLNKSLQLSVNATKPLQGQVSSLKIQLAQIQANLDRISATISQKKKDLQVREDKLALQQALLEKRIRQYYIRSYLTDPLTVVLSSITSGDIFQELSYRQSVTREDKQIIIGVTGEVVGLLTDKQKLEKDQVKLASLQAEVDKNATFLGGEIKKAQAYQSTLNSQIAVLSAKQQDILASRLASLNIPHSAYTTQGGCVDDRGVDPGFGGAFAFFTYGVPNRVGLNQYGAKGRAEAGQSYDQILHAYYNFDSISDSPTQTIVVNGTNEYGQTFSNQSMNIDDYLKHLYEMPTNWPANALQAQAIAARSYAAKVQSEKGFLAPSQADQVVKQEINDGNWQAAVDATHNKVMMQGGSPVKAWFSSTHGGYVLSSGEIGWSSTGWTKHATDTTSGSAGSFGDLQSSAYDKASPWFYCDWGSRAQYNKTAWLQGSEVADIVNVLLLASKDSSTRDHLYQADKPNPAGTDTWDAGRVRQELSSRGGTPFNSVSSVSVSADFSGGRTSSVSISGDGGTVSFAGSDFKTYFDLRAPASIQIVGPLFNVERK